MNIEYSAAREFLLIKIDIKSSFQKKKFMLERVILLIIKSDFVSQTNFNHTHTTWVSNIFICNLILLVKISFYDNVI